MSSIMGALTGGGDAGVNFRAKQADLINPVTQAQTDKAYEQTQTGLGNQSDFLKAVQAQNGLQNQSNVFNQMQGVANGTGPNPAQAQLAQATGANTANQAALMAGQRGSSANSGLIARQAAMQGGQNQQNAAGQAATMQANQSLNALNSMGQLSTNQANQQANATNAYTQSALAQQQNLLGGVGAYNNANVNMMSNMNTTNAGLAAGVAKMQGNTAGGMMNGLGSAMQMIPKLFGSKGMQGDQVGGMMGGEAGDLGGSGMGDVMGGASDAVGMMAAKGGLIKKQYADGGEVDSGITPMQPAVGPQSNVGKSFMDSQDNLASAVNPTAPVVATTAFGDPATADARAEAKKEASGQMMGGVGSVAGGIVGGIFGPVTGAAGSAAGKEAGKWLGENLAEGGPVKAMVSPGEKYLDPKDVDQVKKGANPMQVGEKIPGKPKVSGAKNDYANDTVPKTLKEGGIVLPRSVTQSKDPAKSAAAFVAAILKKESLKKGK